MFPWYADRGAFPEHVERLARFMSRDFGVALGTVDGDLGLAEVVRSKVHDIRRGMKMQFAHELKAIMARRPDLITFDPRKPETVRFDARSAGAGDEIVDLVEEDPRAASDMAAATLKERAPARHMDRLRALKKLKDGLGL